MSRTSTRDRRLSAFIEACLDPHPTAVLTDTAYNNQMRRARAGAWRRATRATRAFDAAIDLCHALEPWGGMDDDEPVPGLESVARMLLPIGAATIGSYWRHAVARQILLPAPDRASLEWKRRAARYADLPITSDQIAAAIAADDAWLAAHPTTKVPRRPRANRRLPAGGA